MTKAKRKKRKKPSLLPAFLLLLFALWFWSEQNWIQIEEIHMTGVPAGNGQRIAIVSDVHGKEFGQDNKTLIEKTRDAQPDLIAITGDFIHDEEQLDMVRPLAEGLAEIAPTYYVTGNHEWASHTVPALKAILEDAGVVVLSNDYRMLSDELALLGAEDKNGRADQKTIAQLADEVREAEGEDCFLLLLSHRNNIHQEYSQAGIDLTLAGHGHGGQIRIPFSKTDGLIGPQRELFPQYTAGLYDLDKGRMFVSRGLSDQFPAFRLFNRPHLPLLILES